MEIKIGVADSPRELVLTVDETPAQVAEAVSTALTSSDGLLSLTDEKGRQVLVPTARLAYVEIAGEERRPVGFGA